MRVQQVQLFARERHAITVETAWMLAAALETTPEFWTSLQTAGVLWAARPARAS